MKTSFKIIYKQIKPTKVGILKKIKPEFTRYDKRNCLINVPV